MNNPGSNRQGDRRAKLSTTVPGVSELEFSLRWWPVRALSLASGSRSAPSLADMGPF